MKIWKFDLRCTGGLGFKPVMFSSTLPFIFNKGKWIYTPRHLSSYPLKNPLLLSSELDHGYQKWLSQFPLASLGLKFIWSRSSWKGITNFSAIFATLCVHPLNSQKPEGTVLVLWDPKTMSLRWWSLPREVQFITLVLNNTTHCSNPILSLVLSKLWISLQVSKAHIQVIMLTYHHKLKKGACGQFTLLSERGNYSLTYKVSLQWHILKRQVVIWTWGIKCPLLIYGEKRAEYTTKNLWILLIWKQREAPATPYFKLDGDSIFREKHLEEVFRKNRFMAIVLCE